MRLLKDENAFDDLTKEIKKLLTRYDLILRDIEVTSEWVEEEFSIVLDVRKESLK